MVSARPETIWFARRVIDEEGEHERGRRSRERRHAHGHGERDSRRAADVLHREEAGHGADEHHPLHSEVEDARPLGEQLAERCEEQGRPVRDSRREHDDDDPVVHAEASAIRRGRSKTTR